MINRFYFRFGTAVVVLAFLVTISGLSLEVQAQSSQSVLGAAGTTWGGEHVRLVVTPEGATLDFDCANGAISQPLQLDAQGNFMTTGTFTREHGGPVKREDPNTAVAATYSGTITGNTMRLNITTGPQKESAGDYVLIRGQAGHVVKCR